LAGEEILLGNNWIGNWQLWQSFSGHENAQEPFANAGKTRRRCGDWFKHTLNAYKGCQRKTQANKI